MHLITIVGFFLPFILGLSTCDNRSLGVGVAHDTLRNTMRYIALCLHDHPTETSSLGT